MSFIKLQNIPPNNNQDELIIQQKKTLKKLKYFNEILI